MATKNTKTTSGNGGTTANATPKTASSSKSAPRSEAFGDRAHEIVNKLSEQLASAEQKLRETASTTQVKASRKADEAQVKTDELISEASSYIRKNPMQSFGIAVLGGAILGMFLKRR